MASKFTTQSFTQTNVSELGQWMSANWSRIPSMSARWYRRTYLDTGSSAPLVHVYLGVMFTGIALHHRKHSLDRIFVGSGTSFDPLRG
mmetsp:Transcript_50589/g.127070  ORF Transcript_50589/g.127070 Transcript_50589/m.127070 type:complete len:88 (+) Transcript_50589:100-363(+)|eukprot:CAMPEP_0177628612 /NCGR_PEP_ID=MMETSP0447-20121125/224_1 /TAXON_ID=0 /ORGANISM="Stygamoeba regulata, Strain BSH-02190019" /LENGTH=87 /DNA_ID=CAMNT_0019129871 /DNA_START=73 /DNA_END=336 /DNA_ORIENTATION=-